MSPALAEPHQPQHTARCTAMPIDPFAALNAMLRAEAARSTEPEDPARSVETDPDAVPPAAGDHRRAAEDGAA